MSRATTAAGGFSLIETIVASGLLAAAVMALAHVFVLVTRANVAARAATLGAILAEQKVEQLRAVAWDATATSDHVDYVDRWGVSLGTGGSPPPGTAYVRRWTIGALPDQVDGVFIHVAISEVGGVAPGGPSPPKGPTHTALTAARTRKRP